MEYSDKTILAPMVRVGTLPMRLLALDYGADIVYTEELVDQSLASCSRVVNDVLGTVDFTEEKKTHPVLRVCPEKEGGRLVLQIGTNDPERALKVAKLVEKDVSGIDVNMGCPKHFSIQGGMGAALLKRPDIVKSILTSLVNGQKNPVTCKIRLLAKVEDTITLCQMIEKCGVAAIGAHGRRKEERPQHPNRNNEIRLIAQSLTVPVIANGGSKEISCYSDIDKFRKDSGASSVMIARAAMINPSIFSKDGRQSRETVIKQYIKYAIDYEPHEKNSKYCIQRMLGEEQSTTEHGRQLLHAVTLKQIAKIWGLEEHFISIRSRRKDVSQRSQRSLSSATADPLFHSEDLHLCHLSLPKKRITPTAAPKYVLNEWCKKTKCRNLKYKTTQRSTDSKFRAIVTVGSEMFSSTFWDRNKKFAENSAAMVALKYLGLKDLLPSEIWEEASLSTC